LALTVLSVVVLATAAMITVAMAVPVLALKPQPSGRLVAGVQGRYEKIKDLQAHFEQETQLPEGRRLAASGEVFFKKPNMIRWDFLKPDPQSIITDGKTMWIYEPAEKQVQVYGAGVLDPRLKMAFFSDLRRLEDDFTLRSGRPAGGRQVLELEPKEGRNLGFRHLTLLISREMRVVESRSTDAAGNVTTVKFSDFKENSGLPNSLFTFTPPQGVRVIKPQGMAPGF
jgi:outer membrane lipoprotein-sorting protein